MIRQTKFSSRRCALERLEERLPFSVGDIDRSFGANGIVRDGFVQTRESSETVSRVVGRSDGGFYLAGGIVNGRGRTGAVWSFNSDGSLQSSFGTNGQVLLPLASGNENIVDMTLGPDGKLMIAGYYRNTQAQASTQGTFRRLNANGSVDTTFGTNGQFNYSNFTHAWPDALATRPTGETLALVESTGRYDLLQFDKAGQLDENFLVTGQPDDYASATGMLLMPDGSVILSLRINQLGVDKTLLVKHDRQGAFDSQFGVQGRLLLDDAKFLHLQLDSSGNVLIAGLSSNGANLFVTNITPRGQLVTGFGNAGTATIQVNGSQYATGLHGLAVHPDGRITLVGIVDQPGFQSIVAYHLTSQGQPDFNGPAGDSDWLGNPQYNDFGTGALVGNRFIHAMASDYASASPNNIQLLAIGLNGNLDANFGSQGKVVLNAETTWTNTVARDVLQLPDDKYLALEANSIAEAWKATQPMLVRYNHDGTIDRTYGDQGRILLSNDAIFPNYLPMQFQKTEHGIYIIVQIGFVVRISKLNADYQFDSTFGTDGWVNWDATGTLSALSDVLITEEAIYLAGRSWTRLVDGRFETDTGIVKLSWQGAVDTSYGDQGSVRLPLVGNNATSYAQLSMQSTGKLIVMSDNDPRDIFFRIRLTRLNLDGQVDASFGNSGATTTSLSTGAAIDRGRKIKVLPDDSLIAIGMDGTSMRAVGQVEKYDADGHPVTSFGTDGKTTLKSYVPEQELFDADIDSQGRIVMVLGFVSDRSTSSMVVRLLPSGQLDNQFSNDGVSFFSLTPFSDAFNCLTISDRDDILLAGSQVSLHSTDSVIVRLIGSLPDETRWHNHWHSEDVSGDRLVTPVDALLVINRLNAQSTAVAPATKNDSYYADVNDDGYFTSLDALLVINYLNRGATTGTGEGESNPAAMNLDSHESTVNQSARLNATALLSLGYEELLNRGSRRIRS